MARGITQQDVDRAADALLAGGEHPAVERIRQHLGTGSPNTVARLLDVWWKTLGSRLTAQHRKLDLPTAPEPVAALASQLWEQALESGRALVEAGLADERRELAGRQGAADAAVEAAVAEVEKARTSSAEALAALAQATDRATDLQRLVDQQAAQIGDLTHQRDQSLQRGLGLEAEIAALRSRLEQRQTEAEASRETQAAHLRAVEDRAHAEIDRARQEARDLRMQLQATEKAHGQQVRQLQSEFDQSRTANTALARDVATHQARSEALDQQLRDLRQSLEAALKARMAPDERQVRGRPSTAKRSEPGSNRTRSRPSK